MAVWRTSCIVQQWAMPETLRAEASVPNSLRTVAGGRAVNAGVGCNAEAELIRSNRQMPGDEIAGGRTGSSRSGKFWNDASQWPKRATVEQVAREVGRYGSSANGWDARSSRVQPIVCP